MDSSFFGYAEKSLTGNAGNPATSQSPLLSQIEGVRGSLAGSTDKLFTPMVVNQVQPSGTSVAAPPTAPEQDFAAYDTYRSNGNGPSREIDEPEKDTIASIAIRTPDGNVVSGYSSFFLQSVSEAEQEKYQIVETFTAYYAFFFGKRPPIYRYSGMLLNDPKNNWMNSFRFMYDNYFRGTASAELGAQAVMTYDKRSVSGFLLGLQIQQDASLDKGVPFSFDLLVINHDIVGFSADFDKFIKDQQDRLQSLRARAQADIASLNKGQDTLQSILKNSVLQGRSPTGSLKKLGESATTRPDTTKATIPTAKDNLKNNYLKQRTVVNDVKTATYGVESDITIANPLKTAE
jgi:hypothetical protein